MKNSSVYIIPIIIMLSGLALGSCQDDGSVSQTPEIRSIDPTSGSAGTPVIINGSGFGSVVSEVEVMFNGTAADVSSVSDSRIETHVPQGAASGVVQVSVGGSVIKGPDFTVESKKIKIIPQTISGGAGVSCGLDDNGDAYCWGSNLTGQLGDGSTSNRVKPSKVKMPAGVSFSAISAGNGHTLALSRDGKIYAWGKNNYGQLGTGTTSEPVRIPTKIELLDQFDIVSVSANRGHSLALTSGGKVYAWGNNSDGQIGVAFLDGIRPTPVQVLLPSGVSISKIDAGDGFSLALTVSGKGYAWGRPEKLGNGSITNKGPLKIKLPADKLFVEIDGGGFHSVALSDEGEAYAWGVNLKGQLGDGTTTDRLVPVAVNMPQDLKIKAIEADEGGSGFTVALAANGEVYAWGEGSLGELGNNSKTDLINPTAVTMPGGKTFTFISAGFSHTLAITPDEEIYGWGVNSEGQVGIPNAQYILIPRFIIKL